VITVIILWLLMVAGLVGFIGWLRSDARLRREIRDLDRRIAEARDTRGRP
jgi:hypothetical protein